MLRFILLAILLILIARTFWRVVDGMIEAARGRPRRNGHIPAVKLVRDPVCGTYVAPWAALSLTAAGSTQYFCSEECRSEYQKQSG